MMMNNKEINEAILGAQYRESREFKLTRMIAYMIAQYLGAIGKAISINKFYPLLFDYKKKKRVLTPEQEAKRQARFKAQDKYQMEQYLKRQKEK